MDRVPVEVWLETFSILNKRTLFSVHRVSRPLHRIARLLLFKHFTFYPYAALGSHVILPGDIHLPGETEVKRIVRRLRFWTSDEVAPLVKECTVAPRLILYEELKLGRYVHCQNYDVILHTFLELLPRFTNLGKLSSTSIKFRQHFLDALGSLPNLRKIELQKCSLDESVMVRTQLKAVRLLVANTNDLVGVQKWLSIIGLQVRTQLSVQPPYAVPALDFMDGDIPVFPNVMTLEIRIHTLTQDVIALQRFPAVRTLRRRMGFPYNMRPNP
ncbi:F-box domain-containing protein [Mycena sanguinolenta]|uniref:F-box domain-containing protein n=1 Tax=Mycena sanguinolenta TaxID=230812 RepID=A0A8H6YIN5_9AGAR|nr:F-box domain-containing protein [Mycena sanguinolenta]